MFSFCFSRAHDKQELIRRRSKKKKKKQQAAASGYRVVRESQLWIRVHTLRACSLRRRPFTTSPCFPSPSTPPSTLRQASSLAPYIRRNKASPLATLFASSRCIRHRGATTCNEYCTSSRKTRTKKRALLLSLLVRPCKRFRVRRPAV